MLASRVPGVVLAAGASTRLGGGRAKQLVEFNGKTLLRRAAEAAVASAGAGVPVIVVLGHRAGECEAELAGLPVRNVHAERWVLGMGASLKTGFRAALEAAPDATGIVVSLCDQPLVRGAQLSRLREAAATGVAVAAAAAEYAGGPGVPAFFGREMFESILGMDDAAGAKGLLLRPELHPRLIRVPMPEADVDVDTPGDLTGMGSFTARDSGKAPG